MTVLCFVQYQFDTILYNQYQQRAAQTHKQIYFDNTLRRHRYGARYSYRICINMETHPVKLPVRSFCADVNVSSSLEPCSY